MKKALIFIFLMMLLSSYSFAAGWGVGVRNIAMGGCGIATANDITAAYFNPAGLMYGPENFEAQAYYGGTLQQINDLVSSITDPDFLENSFDEDLDTTAMGDVGLGFSMRKVGLSLFASGTGILIHPAKSINSGMVLGVATIIAPITLGSTFSTPGLPIASLSLGVNLKPMQVMGGGVMVGPTAGTGEKIEINGSGFGFDMGAQAKITPLVSVGAVVRNLSASLDMKTKVTPVTVAPDGKIDDSGDSVDEKSSYSPAPEVGVGLGITLPLTGTLIACDIENYSYPDNSTRAESYNDFHFGVEQGFFFNLVMLRLGYFNYGPAEDTFLTYGLGFNAGPVNLGLAAANSQKDFNSSIAMAQLGMAF